MKQVWFKTKTILCALLCLLCVMTGCAGEYPAQPDVALRDTYAEASQSEQITEKQTEVGQAEAKQTETENADASIELPEIATVTEETAAIESTVKETEKKNCK